MKTFIGYCLFIACVFNTKFINSQTPIDPAIFGQNAWFIDVTDPIVLSFSSVFDGQLDEIKRSGVRYIRIGGIDVNFKPLAVMV